MTEANTDAEAALERGNQAWQAGDVAKALDAWTAGAGGIVGHLTRVERDLSVPETVDGPGRRAEPFVAATRQCAFHLAVVYDEGRRLERDVATAMRWYLAAAHAGHPDAAFNLAVLLLSGDAGSVEAHAAAYWFHQAAEAGKPEAMFNLGLLFDRGEGLPRDAEQAAQWYLAAAEAGEGRGAANLARQFAMGEGVGRSDVSAFKWYAIAAEMGVAEAARYRERVAKQLSPGERLRAGDLAEDWLREHGFRAQ